MLRKISTDQVKVEIIGSGVGAITTNDVLLASASNAIVVGFNVRPSARRLNWPTATRSISACTL